MQIVLYTGGLILCNYTYTYIYVHKFIMYLHEKCKELCMFISKIIILFELYYENLDVF